MLLAAAIKDSGLVPQRQWKRHIGNLKKEAGRLGFFRSKAAAKKEIHSAVVAAIRKRASENKKFGVLLSGGVDSSFIALILQQLGYKFTCFSVGLEGSRDLAAAQYAAKKMKLKLTSREFTVAAAGKIIKEAANLLKTDDPVTVGIAATEIAALRLAAANKSSVVFTGLGSEEVFAGYQRHVVAKDVHEECWSGLKAMWQRDFLRDMAVAAKFKATALTPFLDKVVIIAAMRAKPDWKIAGGEKKLILREIAAAAGLPKDIAFRPKMAAQYGSGFDKAMERLAKAAGFSNKRDYLRLLL
ncbi:asparagine synthase C-terminal domain-containing protein [Candidatus Woesearchaeota archaeon]|nr:asparagine synthase C-terminal domain-containing protein [Candidatus Woesearchaeota archaeon]